MSCVLQCKCLKFFSSRLGQLNHILAQCLLRLTERVAGQVGELIVRPNQDLVLAKAMGL